MDPTWKNPGFVIQAARQTSHMEREMPTLRDPEHDVLVRPGWTGICGSDVHLWEAGRIGPYTVTSPMTLGHESAGIVEQVGSKVKHLKPGDRVCLEPGIPCRRCTHCKSGKYNLCAEVVFGSTPPHDGMLQRFYASPSDFVYKLPDTMTLEEGALVEPTAVAVHIVKLAPVKPGDSVVIFGAGPIGLLSAAVSRAFGASSIVMVDVNPTKLDFARSFIPSCETYTTAISAENPLVPADSALAILKACPRSIPTEGADISIDASGAGSAIATAIHVLRTGGTFIQGGIGHGDVMFPIVDVAFKEITVKGSLRYQQGDYALAISLISRGVVDAKQLISEKVEFGRAEEALNMMKEGRCIKVLIEGPHEQPAAAA